MWHKRLARLACGLPHREMHKRDAYATTFGKCTSETRETLMPRLSGLAFSPPILPPAFDISPAPYRMSSSLPLAHSRRLLLRVRARSCSITPMHHARIVFRGPDRLAADDHVDRIGVHLRKLPQGHPTALGDRDQELDVVLLSSAGTSFVAATCPLTINSTLRVLPVGILPPTGRAQRQARRRMPPSPSPSPCPACRASLRRPGLAVDGELQGVGIAVGDVDSAPRRCPCTTSAKSILSTLPSCT